MRASIRRTIIFQLEQLVVRGAHFRFLVVLGVMGLLSVIGGLAVMTIGEPELSNPVDATWWAFLRLSDPGYLGDDEGLLKRTISTVLTVLGCVVFLGAMVAILTQWLNATLHRLELGLTPIRLDGHVAVIGWTDRTGIICRDLFSSEGRLKRWLDIRGVRRLRMAVLSRAVGPARMQELSDVLGVSAAGRVILRSGSPLVTAHLERVDVLHAGSVVIPGVEATAATADAQDDTVIKTLCAVAASVPSGEESPPCVCELFDARKVAVARRAYPGPLEVVASDVIVGRLLAYDLDQPGISAVCTELLTHGEGATFYVYDYTGPDTTFDALCRSIRGGIMLGVVRPAGVGFGCRLCPPSDEPVIEGDALVVVAHAFPDIAFGDARASTSVEPLALAASTPPKHRVLVLGWSRRVPAMLDELDRVAHAPLEVTVLAAVSTDDRLGDEPAHAYEHVRVVDLEGDITLPARLREVAPEDFDRIALVASDWAESEAAADARTVSAYHALGSVLDERGKTPPMIVEVTDPMNVEFFDAAVTDAIVSSELIAHLLAQVVLRRELMVVVDDIFGSGPSKLSFVKLDDAAVSTFADAAARVHAAGAIAIGVRHGGTGGAMKLVPAADEPIDGGTATLVVLSRTTGPR